MFLGLLLNADRLSDMKRNSVGRMTEDQSEF